MTSEANRLQNYLASDPDNRSLLGETADVLISAGRAADALKHIDHALALHPDDPAFLYRRAVGLRRTGQPADAARILSKLLAAGESDPAISHELADLQFEQREFKRCVETLQPILSKQHKHIIPQADLLYVRALHHAGELEEATSHAEAALALDQSRNDLRSALASLYLDAERFDAAAQLYAEAVRSGQVTPEISCVGGYLALGQDDFADAERLFSSVLASRPQDGRALLGAGLTSAAEGKSSGAIDFLRRASQSMPTHLGTLNALAWMQLLSGDLDAADVTLQSASELDDTFAETHGSRAVVAAMRGDDARARDLARTALKLDKESFSAAYALILLRARASSGGERVRSMLELLDRHSAPGGASLKDVVLSMVRSSAGRR